MITLLLWLERQWRGNRKQNCSASKTLQSLYNSWGNYAPLRKRLHKGNRAWGISPICLSQNSVRGGLKVFAIYTILHYSVFVGYPVDQHLGSLYRHSPFQKTVLYYYSHFSPSAVKTDTELHLVLQENFPGLLTKEMQIALEKGNLWKITVWSSPQGASRTQHVLQSSSVYLSIPVQSISSEDR